MATKTKSKTDIGRSSKRKGKIGELEVVNLLKAAGYNTHRSVQYCGATGDAPDVVVEGLPLHIEVKRVERLNLKQAYQQAVHDSKANGNNEIPVVFHRRSRQPWMVSLSVEDFLELCKKLYKGDVQ